MLQRVDVEPLMRLFNTWSQQLIKLTEESWVAADGKSLKSTFHDYSESYQNFVSTVSAFTHQTGVVLNLQVMENKLTSEEVTGIAFIDSTPIEVCDPCRSHAHKVFKGQVGWGKNSVGWHFGFKLHLMINDKGELLAFQLTAANTDDREPVPDLTADLIGKLFGDRGYISQALFEQLFERGLQLITKSKKSMKNRLVKLIDKILLRKRALIESVNHQLKNICQIEHSRHRSVFNFLVNVLAGLVAYTYHEKKPTLDLQVKGLSALPPAIF